MDWLKARLAEPSTWLGIAVGAAGLGILWSPELWVSIGGVASAVIGLINMIKKERGSLPPE
jgi:hypothetical protein